MASNNTSNSKSSNTAKRRNRTPGSRGSLLNNLAFYAVIFLALVMLINAILKFINKVFDANISTTATGILTQIALAIAIGHCLLSCGKKQRQKNVYRLAGVGNTCCIKLRFGYHAYLKGTYYGKHKETKHYRKIFFRFRIKTDLRHSDDYRCNYSYRRIVHIFGFGVGIA